METTLLDGRKIANEIALQLTEALNNIMPRSKLAIIQLGTDPASIQYVNIKKKRGIEIGVEVQIFQLPAESELTKEKIQSLIQSLSQTFNGIILQLPLPPTLQSNTQYFLDLIPQELDVDGLNTKNLSAIKNGNQLYLPAVATGVITLIEKYNLLENSPTLLVLGKGKYVGTPIFEALQTKYPALSVTNADIATPDIQESIATADLVISCIGKPHVYQSTDLKQGAILIDVGTSEDPVTKKIVGDFDTSNANGYLKAYTPVPGGVGPMTVVSLLASVARSAN